MTVFAKANYKIGPKEALFRNKNSNVKNIVIYTCFIFWGYNLIRDKMGSGTRSKDLMSKKYFPGFLFYVNIN